MLALDTDWRRENRHARVRLLDHVRQIVMPLLQPDVTDASPMTDAPSLARVLLRAPNALRMRTMLLGHRELLTAELLTAVKALLPVQGSTPPGKALCLAMHLIPRMTGDYRETVTGLLMWGAFCRENRLIQQAERHFTRAAALAEQLDDSFLKRTVIGARAGLYRATNRYREASETLERGLSLAEQQNDAVVMASFSPSFPLADTRKWRNSGKNGEIRLENVVM